MPNTFTPAVKIKQHTQTHLPTNFEHKHLFFFYCNKGRVMNEQKKLFFLSISRHEALLKKKRRFINKASDKFKYTHLSVKAGQLKLLI